MLKYKKFIFVVIVSENYAFNQAEIMADAAYVMLSKNSRDYTGNFAIDEEVLRAEGVTNFTKYAVDPSMFQYHKSRVFYFNKVFVLYQSYDFVIGAPLTADFFIPSIENYPETFTRSTEIHETINQFKKVSVEEDIANVLIGIKKFLSEELVEKMSTVYEFTLTGDEPRKILLDLKHGSGSITENADGNADVKLIPFYIAIFILFYSLLLFLLMYALEIVSHKEC
ncbi:hypothetical protein DICVIV_10630 [Dictyocaulus viviparus]|uniref:Uncharacterized protein n=1 Tax=Dictyocaulus viviparus TaxID=29172 RepID=A0A0D8XI03_DICVI|nr:hypothetical protein DICVIV_10630 [Dictyocaulus viviparus]